MGDGSLWAFLLPGPPQLWVGEQALHREHVGPHRHPLPRETVPHLRALHCHHRHCCRRHLFGIISAMMAIINTASNPIEAICHIPGLYLWNGMALFSTLSAIITWMVQFYLRLTHNVLIREYKDKGKWSSEGMASFGSSFFLVVIAAVVYLVNLTIIAMATRDPHRQRKVFQAKQLHPLPGKQAGDTMLY